MTTLIQLYVKQQTQLKNKLDNLRSGGVEKGVMVRSLHLQLKRIKVEIKKLETSLEVLLKKHSECAALQLVKTILNAELYTNE